MIEGKRRKRTRWLVGAILGAVVMADTLGWFVACRRLDEGARDAAAAAGWSLSADPARWRGWPLAAEIVLPNAVLRSGPDIIPPVIWRSGTQTLRLDLAHPGTLALAAGGPQSLALADAAPVPFTAGSLAATLDLTRPGSIHLRSADLEIATPDGPFRIAAAELDTEPDGAVLRLSTISLPGAGRQPIEPPIDSVRLTARLSTPIVPMPTAAESARRWRDENGQVVIDDAALNWGPLAVTGSGTLVLDPALQPSLTGRLAATGLLAGLDRLVATGAVTPSGALAARGMLTILAAPSGPGPVTLPIALQDGVVSLARIPLLRLAPIRWD